MRLDEMIDAQGYLDKAELILSNILFPVNRSQALVRAVLPLAASRLAREIALDPGAYKLSTLSSMVGTSAKGQGNAPSPEEIIRRLKLPAMPTVLGRLNQAINDPKASAGDIAAVIKLEPSLSSALLRLVNSPVYGFAEPVRTVDRAVAALGTRQAYSLAVGDIVLKAVNRIVPANVDLNVFWEHSIGCAIIARELAQLSRAADPETLFVCGLLHDIGRLVQYVGLPLHTQEILNTATERRIPRIRAEVRVLGYGHTALGATLLRAWSLPDEIVCAAEHHHTPLGAENKPVAALVQAADLLAQMFIIQPKALVYVTPIQNEAWNLLGLDAEQVVGRLDNLDEIVQSTLAVLLPTE